MNARRSAPPTRIVRAASADGVRGGGACRGRAPRLARASATTPATWTTAAVASATRATHSPAGTRRSAAAYPSIAEAPENSAHVPEHVHDHPDPQHEARHGHQGLPAHRRPPQLAVYIHDCLPAGA